MSGRRAFAPDSAPRRRALCAAACAAVLVSGATLDACGALRRGHAPPAVEPVEPVDPVATAWAGARDSARAALATGRAAYADSLLSAFRDRYVGMPQSADALYWRALARLDLPTPGAGVHPAIADLDAYRALAAPEHRAEATALRRALMQLDSARSAFVAAERPTAPSRTALVPRDSLRARDEELQRARADAAAARAELDRVRRRLMAPARRPGA